MKILSLVVPMYNVEKYIEQCLTSFIIKEISSEVEVLIINDGSTDHSFEIVNKYQKKYPELFRVITKENGGHGSAINKGIEEAIGRYFKVVDGDDWVETKGIINLVSVLKKQNADLILSNYQWVDERSRMKTNEVSELCPGISYEKEYLADHVLNRTFLKMHAITYKTALLKRMKERFDEHCFYVDVEYVVFPLPYIKTVLFVADSVYQYRIGLAEQSVDIKNMQKRCGQHEKVLESLLTYYRYHISDSCVAAMKPVISRMLVSQYKIYLSCGKGCREKLVSIDKRIKNEYPGIYDAVENKTIKLLRRSHYILYELLSLILRYILLKSK